MSGRFGPGTRLNYVLNADLSLYSVTAGSPGIMLTQTQFSRLNGAASGITGIGLSVEQGYTFANSISAIDIEASQVGLSITSLYANRNTFSSPYFNCPTPIVATAGERNMLLNPSYGAAPSPAPGSQTGILTLP